MAMKKMLAGLVCAAALVGCNSAEEGGGEAASSVGAARSERDRLKTEIRREQERQQQQVRDAFGNARVENLPAVWSAFVDRTRSVTESTAECRRVNAQYPSICEPGRFLQHFGNVAQLGWFGQGAAIRDVQTLVGNGGRGYIEFLDLIFIRSTVAAANRIALDTRFAFIENVEALKFNIANDIQRTLCSNGSFNHGACSQSAADRQKIQSLESRIAQLERQLAGGGSAAPACNWYKAAPGVQEVYLFDHGTAGESIGAVGATASGRTTYFANRGRYPSTQTRSHVRVVNTASSMHEKVGYINKSQFVVAREKCN